MPALHKLRESFAEAHIAALVGPWGREVMERNAQVDEVITCRFPGFDRQTGYSLASRYRLLLRVAREVRRHRFELALIMRFDHWWGALLAATAGIPHRIGYATPEMRPLVTYPVAYTSGRHEVWQNMVLVASAAPPMMDADGAGADDVAVPLGFAPATSDDERAKQWLLLHGEAADRPLVAIHPGAGAAVKLWTAEKWAALVDALEERRDAQVVITGSKMEMDLVWAIAARTRTDPMIAAGETTLGQLAALYRRCRLVLGPDCGPLHLAVAVGTPTLHLYGPVDARTFGPWGDPLRHRVVTSNWPCVPCNRLDCVGTEVIAHPCVRDISVGKVLSEAESLLAGAW
jgi:heptosyltransferase-2/heptosyltransferase-3